MERRGRSRAARRPAPPCGRIHPPHQEINPHRKMRIYFFYGVFAAKRMSSSGKKDAVVIERGARAGFEALEQIVYLHMSALRPADI